MKLTQQGHGPAVGIYIGHGASHSWTWFADIFDRNGLYTVAFVDERDIAAGALEGLQVLFVSGGDTFAIAHGLGSVGAEKIAAFVAGGGVYIGACAGAYLLLKSSLAPLNMFNFVHARISNLTKNLPAPKAKPEKYCTEYGCRYVFHPVREEVVMRMTGSDSAAAQTIIAPLYGGSAMLPSDDIEVMAEYSDFTEKTEFLVDEAIARKTVLGNVAAARKAYGKGTFYLFGPHFEHPGYTQANRLLIDIVLQCGAGTPRPELPAETAAGADAVDRKAFRSFMSLISNARIAALSLERKSFTWRIGRKVYDPEKIRVFLEAIWSRARLVDSGGGYVYIGKQEMDRLGQLAGAVLTALRDLPQDTYCSCAEDSEAAHLFGLLRETTALFLALYFRMKRAGLTEQQRRLRCTYTSKQLQSCIR
ncbi:BPL-N domain-containing protein [Thermodesulfobacteriota bacterium]